jgi:AraC-like DNA-binding protein
MILTQKEKEDLVIKLLEEQYSLREIAKRVHMSFSDISKIKRKVTGETIVEKETAEKPISITSQSFKLFLENKTLVDVAIFLDISTEEVLKIYSNYLTLQNMRQVAQILKENRHNLSPFLKLFNFINKNNTKGRDIKEAIENINNINALKKQKEDLKNIISDLITQRNFLLDNIGEIRAMYY